MADSGRRLAIEDARDAVLDACYLSAKENYAIEKDARVKFVNECLDRATYDISVTDLHIDFGRDSSRGCASLASGPPSDRALRKRERVVDKERTIPGTTAGNN